jgi:hypothetical protein
MPIPKNTEILSNSHFGKNKKNYSLFECKKLIKSYKSILNLTI